MKETTLGIVLMTFSTVFYGLANPLLKKAGLNPFATVFFEVLFLVICVAPFFLFTKSYAGVVENKNALLLLALVGAINALGFLLLVKSYNYLSIWQVNLIYAALVPLVGAVVAYFILKEQLSVNFFIGLLFTLVGLFIAFR